jgi:dsRNA-specific ribonuclease
MAKFNKKTALQRYVVQTYCGWTEPQYETHIAEGPEKVKEIALNVESIEAIYMLGKEVKLSNPKLINIT